MFLSHIFKFVEEKSSSRIFTNVITFVIQAFTKFIALFLLTSCIVFSERNAFENTFEERTFLIRNASAQAGSMSTTVQSDDDRPVFVFEEDRSQSGPGRRVRGRSWVVALPPPPLPPPDTKP